MSWQWIVILVLIAALLVFISCIYLIWDCPEQKREQQAQESSQEKINK